MRLEMRGIRLASAAAVVAALVLTGCSSDKSSSVVSGGGTASTSSAPTSSAPTSAPATSAPASASGTAPAPTAGSGKQSVTISPSTGLKSGQRVHVTANGFKPNEPLVINECADKGANTGAGDCNLSGLVSTTSDASGKVEADYTVTTGPFGGNNITCSATQACLLSVSQATPSPTEEADVRLQFG